MCFVRLCFGFTPSSGGRKDSHLSLGVCMQDVASLTFSRSASRAGPALHLLTSRLLAWPFHRSTPLGASSRPTPARAPSSPLSAASQVREHGRQPRAPGFPMHKPLRHSRQGFQIAGRMCSAEAGLAHSLRCLNLGKALDFSEKVSVPFLCPLQAMVRTAGFHCGTPECIS